MKEIEIRQVDHGSADYDLLVQLRRQVLRWPLGLDFTPAQIEAERSDIHLGAFEESNCIGCLVLTGIDEHRIKMRQVAVAPEGRGSGIGSRLVRWSEDKARSLGYRTMVLHAREEAVPFYLRLGYSVVGEPFEEVTIPHRAMEKSLLQEQRP